jgi:hypothetical protein
MNRLSENNIDDSTWMCSCGSLYSESDPSWRLYGHNMTHNHGKYIGRVIVEKIKVDEAIIRIRKLNMEMHWCSNELA